MVIRVILAFLLAVGISCALAAGASTQFVLAELAALGVAIPLGARLDMTLQDIIGMAPLYGPIIGVGFFIAFGMAALVIRFLLPGWVIVGYSLAGFTAILVTLLVLIGMFGLVPIAGARTAAGFLAQCLAGGVGGYAFGRLIAAGRAHDAGDHAMQPSHA